jgi:hypothetical protein
MPIDGDAWHRQRQPGAEPAGSRQIPGRRRRLEFPLRSTICRSMKPPGSAGCTCARPPRRRPVGVRTVDDVGSPNGPQMAASASPHAAASSGRMQRLVCRWMRPPRHRQAAGLDRGAVGA